MKLGVYSAILHDKPNARGRELRDGRLT